MLRVDVGHVVAEKAKEGAARKVVVVAGEDVSVAIHSATLTEGVGGLVEPVLPLLGGQQVVLQEEEEGGLLGREAGVLGDTARPLPVQVWVECQPEMV